MQGIWLVAFGLQWVLLLILVVLVAGILRYLGSIQERMNLAAPRISRFDLGERVTDFELPDIRDRTFNSASWIGHSNKVMLVFLSPVCDSCKTVVKQIVELVNRSGDSEVRGWSYILICHGELVAIKEMVEQLLPFENIAILHDDVEESLVSRQYGVRTHPAGIAMDHRGHVIDQTFNPHTGWLYKVMGVSEPINPVETGIQATIVAQRSLR